MTELSTILCDPDGNRGKSTIACLAELHYNALNLPVKKVNDHTKLLQAACTILMAQQNRQPGLSFVDLPRSFTMDPKAFEPFMIAIDKIKAGHVYDLRWSYKEWWFDSPQVWVFCSHVPDTAFLSADRWVFWTIDETQTLRRHN